MDATVLQLSIALLFPAIVASAAASDLLTMTISNRMAFWLAGGFVILAAQSGMGIDDLVFHAATGGIVLGLSFALFAAGWIGGGDAKFAAAIAIWLGTSHTIAFLALAAVCGGLLTVATVTFRRTALPAFAVGQPWLLRLHDDKAGVPYGVALAAAALAVYPSTPWLNLAG